MARIKKEGVLGLSPRRYTPPEIDLDNGDEVDHLPFSVGAESTDYGDSSTVYCLGEGALEDGDVVDLRQGAGDHNPISIYGTGFDYDEAVAAGLHIVRGSGFIARPTGDGYHNPFGNGARHSTTLGGVLLSGSDITAFEGLNVSHL